MNSLYTLGTRQTNSLSADLERLRNGDNSASLLGLRPPPSPQLNQPPPRTDIRIPRRNAAHHRGL
jgi:hypothetical protein